MKLIDKDALVAEIEKRLALVEKRLLKNNSYSHSGEIAWERDKALYDSYKLFLSFANTLEVKEVDNVWHEVDNVNLPQPDKNKIYCVLSKNKYLLARVREHPHDELLQWKCTEFPYHCYDMCEGDKYMQIV